MPFRTVSGQSVRKTPDRLKLEWYNGFGLYVLILEYTVMSMYDINRKNDITEANQYRNRRL